jgi:hypothetical protein
MFTDKGGSSFNRKTVFLKSQPELNLSVIIFTVTIHHQGYR